MVGDPGSVPPIPVDALWDGTNWNALALPNTVEVSIARSSNSPGQDIQAAFDRAGWRTIATSLPEPVSGIRTSCVVGIEVTPYMPAGFVGRLRQPAAGFAFGAIAFGGVLVLAGLLVPFDIREWVIVAALLAGIAVLGVPMRPRQTLIVRISASEAGDFRETGIENRKLLRVTLSAGMAKWQMTPFAGGVLHSRFQKYLMSVSPVPGFPRSILDRFQVILVEPASV
jgi:hypothetical protein